MKKDILPQGDRIRQFLTNGSITSANLNSMLREKGVFLGHSEKNSSVPLLMKTLISPTEFDELWEVQKIKDETVKYRTATIKCTTDLDLKDVFSENINLNKLINDLHQYDPGFSLVGTPHFYFEEDEAIFSYQIKKQNLLENWNESESLHNGAIYISKSKEGDIELSVKQDSTSKETILVNSILSGEVKKILKEKKVIKPEDDFIRIKFNGFTNENRIQFLYAFTANFCIYLDYVSITDIDLYLDENEKAHADVKDFLDEIDSLKLNGKELQNHILLKNNLYHSKLIFASVSLKYNFDIDGVKGTCIIDISFPDYITKKDVNAELQISYNFKINREHKKKATELQLRKKVYKFVEKIKSSSYEKYKKANP
jgi:hypothetical protein